MGFSNHTGERDRVLLVDDEVHLTHLWRLILEGTGRYEVREENQGMRVLQTARAFRPDLVFLDCQLNDTDGSKVAAALHADPELRDVPIVFVTGSVTQDQAHLQGVPTLAKPFNSDTMPRLASAVLEKHRLAKNLGLGKDVGDRLRSSHKIEARDQIPKFRRSIAASY